MPAIVNDCWNTARRLRVLSTVVLLCALGLLSSPVGAADLRQVVVQTSEQYTAELEALAAWCDAQGLSDEAAETRHRAKPVDPSVIRVLALPQRVGQAFEASKNASEKIENAEKTAEWRRRYAELRRAQGQRWFQLARKAINAGHASLAFDLVHAAVAEDPDHETARRLLGYQEYHGEWHTPYEVRKLRSGYVRDDRFGWIRRVDLPRYEKGDRPYGGRWIPAAEDAQLRRDIHDGWDIETEHYLIRTNHSIEAGVQLGRRLEELYAVWKQLFVCYYATPAQVEAMFGRRPGRITLPRHKIVYFRDRREYNEGMRGMKGRIESSEGMYIGLMQRAYFFGGDDADQETQLHEATHQLFYESRPVAQNVGATANCWVVEGIAMYMESLRREGDYFVVGGFDTQRMRAARYRLLKDKFYVPFNVLTRYGLPQLQSDPRMATLYSQMAGWTQFLIYYDQGRYRDALVKYLTAVFNGSQDPALLSRLTGASYDDLDRQYREFMERGKP
ncbi:MAG TPA: DUF1570 domain-containing protein [Thermoguttaceae bacterium]|nr:DUF1570 domain-containing protein [Thermoguttaceae bacterium]